jgi:NAD(P)-dependent dehydrogenase (short-subunit alcohol dehydrogenase family)
MGEGIVRQKLDNPFRLDGRAILVTGATGHLGGAIARAVARAGALCVIAGRNAEKLDAVRRDIELIGPCRVLQFDVANALECETAIDTLAKERTGLAGIVNCAYAGTTGTIGSIGPADFEIATRQTLSGPFVLVKSALPLLRDAAREFQGGASIVNVASMYAHVSPDHRIYGESGRNNPPHYGALKAGLVQLTRYLAAHLGGDGIRCNSVSPGPFPPANLRDSDPAFYQALCQKTVLGRIGSAPEVADPVVFLLSPAAAYVTGADLAIDGGWTAW